jgi:hypothetical protein
MCTMLTTRIIIKKRKQLFMILILDIIHINNKKLIILCAYKIDIKNERTRNAALILYKISNLVLILLLPLT